MCPTVLVFRPTRSNPFLLCLPLLLHTPPSLVCFSHPASVTPFGRTDLSLLEPLYRSLRRTTVPRPGQRLADHWCRCTKALTPGGDSSRCSTRQSSPAGSGESTLCGIQPELPPHLLSCFTPLTQPSLWVHTSYESFHPNPHLWVPRPKTDRPLFHD